VTPGFFFEGYPDGLAAGNLGDEGVPANEPLDQREIMSLIRGYNGIKDPALKADLLRLVGRMGHREIEE
jgi:hypothetical protein